MNTQTKVIKTKKTVFSDIKEQSIEADLILPDYYPDISKILKCSVVPVNESVTVSGDRISVAGIANIKLIFCGDEKTVNIYETQVKYTKVLQCTNVEATDTLDVVQSLGVLNYKALGPKRVEIKATAVVKVNVQRLNETAIISEVDKISVQKHTCVSNYMDLTSFICSELEINEKVTVKSGNIKSVLRNSLSVNVEEIKPIKNKVMIKGVCDVVTSYIAENGEVCVYSYKIPFSEICDAYGITEDCICNICIKGAFATASVKEHGNSGCVLDVNVKVPYIMLSGIENELAYIDDIYSTKNDIKTNFVPIVLIKKINKIEGRFRLALSADSYDENICDVCDTYADDIRYTVDCSSGFPILMGSVTLNCVLKNTEGQYALITRTFAFEEKLPENSEACEFVVGLEGQEIAASIQAGGKVNFSIDIKYCGFCFNTAEHNILCNIDINENAKENTDENVVVYFAHSGEKLWDIAKENCSTVELISSVNNISGDVVKQDGILVFPNF